MQFNDLCCKIKQSVFYCIGMANKQGRPRLPKTEQKIKASVTIKPRVFKALTALAGTQQRSLNWVINDILEKAVQ